MEDFPGAAGVLDEASGELVHRGGQAELSPGQAAVLGLLIRAGGQRRTARQLALDRGISAASVVRAVDLLGGKLAKVPGPGVRIGYRGGVGGGYLLEPAGALVIGRAGGGGGGCAAGGGGGTARWCRRERAAWSR